MNLAIETDQFNKFTLSLFPNVIQKITCAFRIASSKNLDHLSLSITNFHLNTDKLLLIIFF